MTAVAALAVAALAVVVVVAEAVTAAAAAAAKLMAIHLRGFMETTLPPGRAADSGALRAA